MDQSQRADEALAGMGYKAQLPRHLSTMSILGLSLAIMAVPFGLSTTLYISLTNGQAVTVLWGWVLVSLVSLCIAASLAEICAVYPTAGGVYYWSFILSDSRYCALVSFVCGWLNAVGAWTVGLSIAFGGGQLILSAVSIFDPSFVPTAWQTVLVFWAVMVFCALVNCFAARYLDAINTICIYWTAAAVVLIMITLLATAKNGYRSASFVFAHYDASASGWPHGWSFFVGLLQASYTLTGYGMVAAVSEETSAPEREVPKAMVLSVLAAGFTGILYLVPLLFVLPDIAALLAIPGSQPIGFIFKTVTGSTAGGFCLLLLILGIWIFSAIGALTAASRTTYAFARDGAIPGYKIWSQVHKGLDVPVNAVVLSTLINCLLGLIYLGSPAAFNSFTGVATICLDSSYAVPVLVNLLRRRVAVRDSPFSLGTVGGYLANGVSVVSIAFSLAIFCMPVQLPVDPGSMNYASVVFAGFATIAFVWYFVYARRNFTGPPVGADVAAGVQVQTVSADTESDGQKTREEATTILEKVD